MNFKNFRNYEVLNENPRIVYVEADYIGAPNEYAKCIGYIQEFEDEKLLIFSADRTERTKQLFKKCTLKQLLNPQEKIVIKIDEKVGVN